MAKDQAILSQLAACTLIPDEPPVFQSGRGHLYQEALDTLVAKGLAYSCACSRSDIEQALAAQGRPRLRGVEMPYPGTCRSKGLPLVDGCGWRVRLDDREEKEQMSVTHREVRVE